MEQTKESFAEDKLLILKKNSSRNTIAMSPFSRQKKSRAKPVILLQDATGKGSQWSYLERRPPSDWIEVGFDDKRLEKWHGRFWD